VGSSVVLEIARRRLRTGARIEFNWWWAAGTALGLAFLGGQTLAWREWAAAGIYLTTNPSASFFYVLTAAHGAHVIGGLSALAYVAIQAFRYRLGPAKRTAVDLATVFWHFLDGLWLYILGLLVIWG
jgi:cytochrome c oxidase subunit 3